jgi:hydroxymethylbilane synthase
VTGGAIRIGTRRSALARTQAEWVRARLRAACPGVDARLVLIETQGDRLLGAPLAKFGGKGLFVKELEEGLLEGRVDIAVHSLKDVPVELPEGLHLAAICEREDPRDALVARRDARLAELPPGARVGTSSLRRQALLKTIRPDLQVVPIRGNVQTRLGRLDEGGVDAIVLALAGLRRLGLEAWATEVFDPGLFVPAIGQGALAIESRADDAGTNARAAKIDHGLSARAAAAERAFLARLGGGCQVPLGAYATLEDGELLLRAFLGSPDGARVIRGERRGGRADGEQIGRDLAEVFLAQGAGEIIAELEGLFAPGIDPP